MNKVFEICENVLFDEFEGQGVLLNVKNEKIMTMNDTGTFILNHIKEGVNQSEQLLNVLLEEYDGEEKSVKKDLTLFLNELMSKGLICFNTLK